MAAISVGSVEVDVVPSTQGIRARLQRGLVPAADQVGEEVGRIIGRHISVQVTQAVRDGVTRGGRQAQATATRQGEAAGGAFARSLRARLEAAFRSMPKLNVGLNDTGVDADLARLRARLESLAGKTIGIDIDAETARAQAEDIEERLRRIGAAHPNVAVRADTAAAIAQLRLLREEIDSVSRDPAHIRVETDGGFGARLRAAVQQAEASLPNINITADTTPAQVEVARLRAVLTSLSDARIGIDIDAETAMARVAAVQARLAALSASDADVAVRVDAGAALAQLVAFQAAVNRLDGQSININTRTATANLHLLVTAALAFGPALLPVLPVAAAGLGAVAAAAAAAGAGLGAVALVAVPAFKQISTVLQAQKAAQDAATRSTLQGGQAASQGAQRALQMASAQQALAAAERNGARQIAQAQQQIVQAKQAAADAVTQAAQQNEQAARRVQDAERSLADAQTAARKAQDDLTAARRTAAQELEDLNNQLADSVLSQRDAEIQLREAAAQRDAVLKDANATELDKQKALLAYDQAVQRLKEQTTETDRLKKETAAANKAGVEGSKTVTTAQDRLAEAQRKVADEAQAVKDAQADAARTQVQTARQVAEAQQRVSEATANVAVAQQNAAEAVASAQRQIESASLSAAGGVDQAALAQAKYQAELAKLTPSARETYNSFVSLKTAFGAWSKSLQPAVMPIFTRALDGLKNSLPGLTPFVLAAADAIGDLQDRVSRGFKSPWWKGFKKDLQGSVKPAITGLGIAFGNVFKGMAGVIDAFLPHMDGISGRMQSITKRFANWGTHLTGSPEFEDFLDYVKTNGPIFSDTMKKILGAVLALAEALSPISGPLLRLLGGVADFVATVAEHAPGLIAGIYGLVVAWRLWTVAMWLFNLALAANPIVLIIMGIIALIAIVVWAYNKFGWFRAGVQAVWAGIQIAAQALVDWFTGPFKRFFTVTIPGIFQWVLDWVKRNWPWILGALTGPIGLSVVYIIQHWDDIKAGLSAAWAAIKSWVLYPIRDFFTKTIPGWGNTLKSRTTAAWNQMRDGFSHTWDQIKSWVLYPLKDFFTKTVPGWGTTLKDRIVGAFEAARDGIRTAWDAIKDIAKAPISFVVNTVYNKGIRRVWNLVTDAFGGKHLDEIKGFATGGIMPGYTPGRDVHLVNSPAGPVGLSGGEAIMRPEWTRAVGSGFVNFFNSVARNRGVAGVRQAMASTMGAGQAFADGGIFSGIGDALGGAWDKVKSGASWLKDTFGGAIEAGVKHVVNPLINAIPGGEIGFTGLLKNLMKGAVTRLIAGGKEGDKKATPNIKYSPTAGVEQWRPVVLQALREVGQPSGNANRTLRRMQQESGGNPTIVNRWDSNWQAGHPSVGLMQVIGPTFRSYAGKYRSRGPFSYGVSVDPLANVYSSMRYALGSYGSLAKAYDRPGGYDSGGWLMPGGLGYNGLSQPEAVLTPSQSTALVTLAAAAAAPASRTPAPAASGSSSGGLQPGDRLALRIGDRQFDAYVENLADGVMTSTLLPVARAISGRRG